MPGSFQAADGSRLLLRGPVSHCCWSQHQRAGVFLRCVLFWVQAGSGVFGGLRVVLLLDQSGTFRDSCVHRGSENPPGTFANT